MGRPLLVGQGIRRRPTGCLGQPTEVPRRADPSRFVWSPHVHTLDFSSIATGSGRDLRRPSAAVGPATALACAALVAPASEQAAGYVGPLGGWQRSAGYASN
jgi:hypothetical protein